MFFDDWEDLKRILIVGTLAYVALVVFLRISGKRTLTKLNAFDLVITVALGSTLSAVVLDKSVSLTEGVLAFSLLIFLQFIITWMSVRFQPLEQFVKSEPTLLLRRGEYLDRAMRDQRITRSEILSAIRNSGNSHIKDIAAVVIETDGSLSVVQQASNSDGGLSQLPSWPTAERNGDR
jgi:uncharacterized membrane protein YcaP (DUF421 family)